MPEVGEITVKVPAGPTPGVMEPEITFVPSTKPVPVTILESGVLS